MANDPLSAVGDRLRSLRTGAGTTLAGLSDQTGISVSTLSRLESGHRRPTLELLLPLAKVYGVTLDELVDAPATGDPRVQLKPFRTDQGTTIPLTNRPGGVRAYKLILRRQPNTEREQRTHEGWEWLMVLDGRLRLLLGEHDLVLEPGEVAEFDTRTPHWMGPADRRAVEVLGLFGPQGERIHVRARPKRG